LIQPSWCFLSRDAHSNLGKISAYKWHLTGNIGLIQADQIDPGVVSADIGHTDSEKVYSQVGLFSRVFILKPIQKWV